jgi:hypothetical protein
MKSECQHHVSTMLAAGCAAALELPRFGGDVLAEGLRHVCTVSAVCRRMPRRATLPDCRIIIGLHDVGYLALACSGLLMLVDYRQPCF